MLHLDGEPAALIEMRPEADHLLIVNVACRPPTRAVDMAAPSWRTGRTHPFAWLGEVASTQMTASSRYLKLYERVGYRVNREEVSPHLGVAVYRAKLVL
jgi:hypothetical protein